MGVKKEDMSPSGVLQAGPDLNSGSIAKVPVAMFIAMFAMGPAAFQIFLPALPELSRQFSPAPGVLALTVSLATAAFAVATLVYGSLIDRFGRRNFLLTGCALLCLGSLVCATSTSIEIIIIGRIMQSIGGAAGVVVSRTVVMDLYQGLDAMKVMSNLAAASVIVPMCATMIGGLLAEYLGWRFNFLAIVALAATVLALGMKLLPETRPMTLAVRRPKLFGGYGQLLRSRIFICFSLQNASALGANAVFMVAMPLLFSKSYGFSLIGIGLVFVGVGFAFLAGTLASTRLPLQRNRRSWIMWAATVSALVPLASLLMVLNGRSVVIPMLSAMIVVNFANGLIGASIQAGAIRAVTGAEGTASGMLVFMGSLSMAGMMQAWGFISGGVLTASAATMGLIAACCVISMLCALVLPKEAAQV